MIQVYVASCTNNRKAFKALEHSIRKNTDREVEIYCMYNGDGVYRDWNEENWGTAFTPYRWSVPERANFSGKAIYLDVDVVVQDDIGKLWDMEIPEGKVVVSLPGNYSVVLFDCAKFRNLTSFRTMEELKTGACVPAFGGIVNAYYADLADKTAPLPAEWNCLDGKNCDWRTASLIHFTRKDTQPWRPYADKHEYKAHEIPELEQLWWSLYQEAVDADPDAN